MNKTLTSILTAGLVLTSSGCAGSAYNRVFKNTEYQNSRTYSADFETSWDAVNRATLGLNFGIDKEEKEKGLLEASRYFQNGKKTTTITLKASLQKLSEDETTVYANAAEKKDTVYVMNRQRISLLVIPVFWGDRGKEASRVTDGIKTVEDKKFYQAFFDKVGNEVEELERKRNGN